MQKDDKKGKETKYTVILIFYNTILSANRYVFVLNKN